LLAPGHVAVQRHRLDPEHRAESPHRQAGQSLVVDELQSGIDDPLAAQRHPGRRWVVTTDDGRVPVQELGRRGVGSLVVRTSSHVSSFSLGRYPSTDRPDSFAEHPEGW
jgi:hypothetical protein